MKSFWEFLKQLLEKWFNKDDQEDDPTPTPEPEPTPDPSTTGPEQPALVACAIQLDKDVWKTPGICVCSEHQVKSFIPKGRDKGTSISFVESKLTNIGTGETYSTKWQSLWDGTTNTPKQWDWLMTTPHMISEPLTKQNWHQAGHAYTTGHTSNQPLADGTRRGRVWLPIGGAQGVQFKVDIKAKCTVNRGIAFFMLVYSKDGKLYTDIYKQNQRSGINSSVWTTVSTSFVFNR